MRQKNLHTCELSLSSVARLSTSASSSLSRAPHEPSFPCAFPLFSASLLYLSLPLCPPLSLSPPPSILRISYSKRNIPMSCSVGCSSALCLLPGHPATAFEIALYRSGESCSSCLFLFRGFWSSPPLSTISRLNTVSAAILEEHFHKLQKLLPGFSLLNSLFATAEIMTALLMCLCVYPLVWLVWTATLPMLIL